MCMWVVMTSHNTSPTNQVCVHFEKKTPQTPQNIVRDPGILERQIIFIYFFFTFCTYFIVALDDEHMVLLLLHQLFERLFKVMSLMLSLQHPARPVIIPTASLPFPQP